MTTPADARRPAPFPETSPAARAGQVGDEQPPRGRLARLFQAAERRRVPLRTILVTVGVVVVTYLAGKLLYMLRDIVLLVLVAGFVAMLLNPAVDKVQRRIPRRGPAVLIITLCSALVFIGLAAAFGVPLANGITHLADRLPGYIASAEHGQGWIGHLVAKYHVQSWVQRNTPKLVGYAQSLASRPLPSARARSRSSWSCSRFSSWLCSCCWRARRCGTGRSASWPRAPRPLSPG